MKMTVMTISLGIILAIVGPMMMNMTMCMMIRKNTENELKIVITSKYFY